MVDLIAADYAIRQLHGRLADATYRKDSQSFANCFAEQCDWKIAGMHMTSRAEIAERVGPMLGFYNRVLINSGHTIFDVTDEGLIGRLPMFEFAQMADGSTAMSMGWYHDWYAQEDGQWLYKKRHWNFQYRGPMDFSGVFPDRPDYGPPPGMPGPDEGTYVRPQS